MRKNPAYLFVIISGTLFVLDLLSKINYFPDDTFIYLQYSRNLAQGLGFSFNAGEPSYGITSPLWSILLAIPYLLGSEGYWFAKILDLIFAILSIYMFYKLSFLLDNKDSEHNNDNRILPYLAVSIFMLNTWFIRWAFTGMETSLAVFMMLTVFYFYLQKKYKTSFLLLGFFYLIRPESVVLFAVLLIHNFFKTKDIKALIIYIVLSLIPVLPFLIYANNAFGTFIPNTAIGKTSFNIGLGVYTGQLKRIFQTAFLSSAVEVILSFGFIIYLFYKKDFKDYLILPIWIAGLIILYLVTDSDIISRYLMIMIPVFTLLAIKYISYLRYNKTIIALILFVIIAIQSQAVYFFLVKPHTDSFTAGVNSCFVEIGEWLKNNTPEKSKILVNDVGVIGYYSNRYIIDAAALINSDLTLNKNIMQTPLEEREVTYNLLRFTDADYMVQRDKEEAGNDIQFQNRRLQFLFAKQFPGLGMSDPTPKWYNVYKIIK